MSSSALISIHPEHIENILAGRKFFEYRKVLPRENVTHLVLYSTAPVMKIVAVVEVNGQIVGSPTSVWEKTSYGSGISEKFYRSYFSGQKKATAFVLGKVHKVNESISLRDLQKVKSPPQSFSYLDDNDFSFINRKLVPTDISRKIFLGGVHGVGKSTICNRIFSPAGFYCVTASSLLKRHLTQISEDKRVQNISSNQEIILNQFQSVREQYPRVVLDGHYTLLNGSGDIEPIELDVFKAIAPSRLILIEEIPSVIAHRLSVRDGNKWDESFIADFLSQEKEHALRVSEMLKVPLEIFSNSPDEIKRIKRTVHWRGLPSRHSNQ